MFDTNIPQSSVATSLRCDGKFYYLLYYKFTAKSVGERILKIGQQYAKSEPRVEWHCFPDTMYNM